MNQQHTIHLSSWARLVGLALLLGVGVLASLGIATRTAHAQSAVTSIVSTCDDATLRNAINNANSGDTIKFGCSGTITLGSTLGIGKDLTLDGSGQSVILDGGGSVQVLVVNSGVTFTLNALTIAHSSASSFGGGIDNFGTVSISNSTFANNFAGEGGGLYNSGTVNITTSTFSGNSAPGGGGGGIFNQGTVSISTSTFSGNSAPNGAKGGGGIANAFGGAVSISTSTFSGNSACCFGGGITSTSGTVNIGGSIVVGNTPSDCGGGVSDQGYNLEGGTSCGFTASTDLQNTDPKLDPNGLQNNGGPTQTIALLASSPAIDHIPAANCPATDQRGVTRPDDPSESKCDIGAYESNYDDDLGLTNVPANITTNATSPQGAVVHYTPPTATDESGDSSTASVTCTPASGSTFPIGTTTVTCTATDSDDTNSPVSQSFTVTVNDTDLGLTNLPTNLTVNATSPQGATVTYTPPTAVDEDSPLPPVNCTPASGSTFPIGTTTVTCTVSDSDDTPSSVSQTFTVTVNGAATQVSNLINTVNSFGLPADIQAGFDTQLQAVQTDLTNNNPAQACSDLTAFINHVQAQSGKHLTVSQANQLLAAAKQVQAVLGC